MAQRKARSKAPKRTKSTKADTVRQIEHERVQRAKNALADARTRLRSTLERLTLHSPQMVQARMEGIRNRFLTTAKQLEATLAVDQYLDPKFMKRVENAAVATNRLQKRNARVNAEPVIRAVRGAYKQHRGDELASKKQRREEKQKQRASGAKVPRGAKMRETEEAIVREIEAIEGEGHALVPVWNAVRVQMYQRAKASNGHLSPFEAFLEYVESHPNEVLDMMEQRMPTSTAMAHQQAQQAKKRSRASGEAVPSAAFEVPPKPARKRGRPRKSAPVTTQGPATVLSRPSPTPL